MDEEHAVAIFAEGATDGFPAVFEGSGLVVINQGKLLKAGIGMPFPVDVKGAVADGHLEPFVRMIDLAIQPVLTLDLSFRIGKGGRDAPPSLRQKIGPSESAPFRGLDITELKVFVGLDGLPVDGIMVGDVHPVVTPGPATETGAGAGPRTAQSPIQIRRGHDRLV